MAQTHYLSLEDFRAHDPDGGRGGRWLCPVPECSTHTDPRRHRSVSMVEETGLWNCKRCKARGQLTERWRPFVPKSRKEIEQEASRRRRSALLRVLASCKKPLDAAPSEKAASSEWRWRLGSLQRIAKSSPALQFLKGRGFDSPDALDLLAACGVRVASDFARRNATEEKRGWGGALAVVFPVRDALGHLVAGQGRFVKPLANGPKCLTFGDRQAGVFATPGALEDLLAGRPVAVCEAPLDALSLALAGLPSVALCGSDGVPAWLTRRAFGRRFLLAFDADKAGDEAAQKISEELRALGGIVSRLRPDGQAKDFNEALQNGGPETLRALIAREVGGSKATGERVGTTFATAPNPPQDHVRELRAEWLEMARQGVNVPALDDFIAAKLALAGPSNPALEMACGVADALELLRSLLPHWDGRPVKLPGVTITDPARWVSLAAGRAARLWESARPATGDADGQAVKSLDIGRRRALELVDAILWH